MSQKSKVLKYLEEHIGQRLFADDMAQALGLSRIQVSHAIYGIRKSGLHVEQVSQGVYMYSGGRSAGSVKGLFEELAQTRTGKIIVQDEDGKVYLLTELE